MSEESFKEYLKHILNNADILISEEQLKKFYDYYDILSKEKTNVTAIKEQKDVALKLFADSITVLNYEYFAPGANIIDIGTGGGFPGLPIKIMREDLRVTLIDSASKKVKFVKQAAAILGLDVNVYKTRAEELGLTGHRESYDAVLSKAVAPLNILCELCIPFVKQGGYFIAYKGPAVIEEKHKAVEAIDKLGGKVVDIIKQPLPQLEHYLLVIKKIKPTTRQYPRQYSRIIKKPL